MCVPLVGHSLEHGDDEVLGGIELLDKSDRAGFDDEDLKLLVLIAGQASRAIELARPRRSASTRAGWRRSARCSRACCTI